MNIFGIRRTLESANIPAPTMLMAQLIAMKVAEITIENPMLHFNGRLDVPLREGRTVYLKLDQIEGTPTVEVVVASSAERQIVTLSTEETKLIADAMTAHGDRQRMAREAAIQARSQKAALEVIEDLINVPSTLRSLA